MCIGVYDFLSFFNDFFSLLVNSYAFKFGSIRVHIMHMRQTYTHLRAYGSTSSATYSVDFFGKIQSAFLTLNGRKVHTASCFVCHLKKGFYSLTPRLRVGVKLSHGGLLFVYISAFSTINIVY